MLLGAVVGPHPCDRKNRKDGAPAVFGLWEESKNWKGGPPARRHDPTEAYSCAAPAQIQKRVVREPSIPSCARLPIAGLKHGTVLRRTGEEGSPSRYIPLPSPREPMTSRWSNTSRGLKGGSSEAKGEALHGRGRGEKRFLRGTPQRGWPAICSRFPVEMQDHIKARQRRSCREDRHKAALCPGSIFPLRKLRRQRFNCLPLGLRSQQRGVLRPPETFSSDFSER